MADREQEIEIDWAAASVSDGRLTVPYTSKPSAEWLERLDHVIGRLGRAGSDWGAIDVAKKKLRVDDVAQGSEADLRHFLEAAVLQANAAEGEERAEAAEEERAGPDQEMTDAFRSFGS
jgi:hypothetical protein